MDGYQLEPQLHIEPGALKARLADLTRYCVSGDRRPSRGLHTYIEGKPIHANQHTQTKVFRATGPNDSPLVIKRIDLLHNSSVRTVVQLKNEVAHLRRLDHPNIVHMRDTWCSLNALYMVFDEADDLYGWMDGYPLGAADASIQTVNDGCARALRHMHDKSIYHLDVKPENILVRSNLITNEIEHVRLTDFGTSVGLTDLTFGTYDRRVGSLGFMAPEIFARAPYSPGPADVWSLGCVLLELLWGWKKFATIWTDCYNNHAEPSHALGQVIEAERDGFDAEDHPLLALDPNARRSPAYDKQIEPLVGFVDRPTGLLPTGLLSSSISPSTGLSPHIDGDDLFDEDPRRRQAQAPFTLKRSLKISPLTVKRTLTDCP